MKRVFVFPTVLVFSAVLFIGLHSFNVFETKPFLEYSMLVLILLVAIIQSYRNWNSFKKNERLSEELAGINGKLEKLVEERTSELHIKNEELANSESARTKMLAYIAHDLGSPIVGIQTYLNLMLEGSVQTDDREVLGKLYEKTEYVKRLVDDLFELSKLEAKELSFLFEPMPFKEFILEAFYRFEADLNHESKVLKLGKLETTISNKEVLVNIDFDRMIQVLQNFIGNAVKFNSHVSQPIVLNGFVVNHEPERQQEMLVCVEIVDKGEGISPEELPYVFQRFYRKKEGNNGGSGLGLPIAKEIIEQHGGKVGIKSKLGIGSTCFFTLPCFLEDESPHVDS